MMKNITYDIEKAISKIFFIFGKSEFPIVVALILLVSTPFLLVDRPSYANQIITYVYYLLIIGVIWQFFMHLRERRRMVKESDDLDGINSPGDTNHPPQSSGAIKWINSNIAAEQEEETRNTRDARK